jgi:hypothetical protein
MPTDVALINWTEQGIKKAVTPRQLDGIAGLACSACRSP